jgi:hypothetical protein
MVDHLFILLPLTLYFIGKTNCMPKDYHLVSEKLRKANNCVLARVRIE